MDPVAITVGSSWILAGLLCIAVSIPLVRGQIRRNVFYGVRIRQSFQSDDAWLAINRFGGWRLIFWSIPMIVVGGIALFLPLRSNVTLTWVLGFAPLIFVLIPAFESWSFARRYEARKP